MKKKKTAMKKCPNRSEKALQYILCNKILIKSNNIFVFTFLGSAVSLVSCFKRFISVVGRIYLWLLIYETYLSLVLA